MNRLPYLAAALMLTTARFVPYDAGVIVSSVPGQTVTGEALNLLDQPGADHVAMEPYWSKVADIVAGTARMREKHDTYLPKFEHETPGAYNMRWNNSKFTNIYRDILEGLASKPFEKEVTLNEGDEKNPIVIPETVVKFCEDVDGSGNNLTVFAADWFFNGVNSAIDWVFVDYSKAPRSGDRVRTVAEERRLGLRPFWSHVLAANVLDVHSRIINGKERIIYMRVLEIVKGERFIRLMRADEYGAAWELYREVTGDLQPGAFRFEFMESGPFTIGIIPMVPFMTGRRMGKTFRFSPMLEDAADLQIELYQQESGLKNIRNLSGYPILSGNGVKPAMEGVGKNAVPKTISTGPSGVLYGGMTDGHPGSWEFIQPDASLFKELRDDVKATIDQLRELGRQPLTAQSGNLTVITTAVAAKKGNSAVQMWALGLKDAIENALVITDMWYSIPQTQYDPNVTVFTDFDVDGRIEDLNTLNTARKNKDLSQPQYLAELKRRSILRADFDEDQNSAELLLEPDDETETGLPPE